jgi:flagellin
MKVNYNISAVIANNSLKKNDSLLSASSQKLSSGYKINQAKDDPSGIAIGKKMRAQIRALEQADQNSNDAISVVETSDGALMEVHDMLQRMNELAVKAGTDTATDEDRELIDEELQQLKEEIERIAKDTDFNGQKLLDGTFDRKGYTGDSNAKMLFASDSIASGVYSMTITASMIEGNLEITAASIDGSTASGVEGFLNSAQVDMDGSRVTFSDNNGNEIKMYVSEAGTYNLKVDVTDIGSMRVQIGANEGQVLSIRIPEVSLVQMGMENTNVLTKEAAQSAIDEISEGISYVSSVRSRLGSYQNRLEHTTSSLDITQEEMTSAYSRIMDVDMAEEMTEYTNLQVLVQAGTSMVAQANERPQQVLQLLQ